MQSQCQHMAIQIRCSFRLQKLYASGRERQTSRCCQFSVDTCGYGKRTRCKNHTGDCGTLPMEEKADMSYAPRKIAFREEKERLEPISVPKAFIDTNQHMNNAQYIRTALEFVPEDFHIRQVRVEYKKAAVLHDQLYPFIYKDDQIIKILLGDAEGQAYAVVEFKR